MGSKDDKGNKDNKNMSGDKVVDITKKGSVTLLSSGEVGTEDSEQSDHVYLRPPRKRSAKVSDRDIPRLHSLRCFPRVDELVRAGVFARTIAAYIQDDAGEYSDVSFEKVVRVVRKYRDQLETAGVKAQQELEAVKGDEGDPLYELYEMQKNYRQLKERIDMEVSTEKQLNKLFSTTHKEYHVAFLMLDGILERKHKLGIINKDMDKKQRRLTQGTAGRLEYGEIVANPESRQKVLSVVEMLLGDSQLMDAMVMNKSGVEDSVFTGTKGSKNARRNKRRKTKIRKDG